MPPGMSQYCIIVWGFHKCLVMVREALVFCGTLGWFIRLCCFSLCTDFYNICSSSEFMCYAPSLAKGHPIWCLLLATDNIDLVHDIAWKWPTEPTGRKSRELLAHIHSASNNTLWPSNDTIPSGVGGYLCLVCQIKAKLKLNMSWIRSN